MSITPNEAADLAIPQTETLPAKPDPTFLLAIKAEELATQIFAAGHKTIDDKLADLQTVDYDVRTTAGLAIATDRRATARKVRTQGEADRKAYNAPALALQRTINAAFKKLEERAQPLEDLHDKEIQGEIERKRIDAENAAAAERLRVAAIEDKIANIRLTGDRAVLMTSAQILALIEEVGARQITIEEFSELAGQALQAHVATVARLKDLHVLALEREAEQVRIEAERIELARLRKEADDRAASEALERQRQDDARKQRDEEDRVQRDRDAAEARRVQDAEAAALKKARDQLDADMAEFRRQQKELADQQEAARVAALPKFEPVPAEDEPEPVDETPLAEIADESESLRAGRLKQYILKASFAHGADRHSALELVDEIADEPEPVTAETMLVALVGEVRNLIDQTYGVVAIGEPASLWSDIVAADGWLSTLPAAEAFIAQLDA